MSEVPLYLEVQIWQRRRCRRGRNLLSTSPPQDVWAR